MEVLLERARQQALHKKRSLFKSHIIKLSAHALAAIPRTVIQHIKGLHDEEPNKLSTELYTQIVLEIVPHSRPPF